MTTRRRPSCFAALVVRTLVVSVAALEGTTLVFDFCLCRRSMVLSLLGLTTREGVVLVPVLSSSVLVVPSRFRVALVPHAFEYLFHVGFFWKLVCWYRAWLDHAVD